MANKKKDESEAKATPDQGNQPGGEARTITLSVKERLLLSELFPERSNLVDQWTAKDIADKIMIGKNEREEINLRSGGRGVIWDDKKEKPLTISLSQVEVEFLKAQVERINKTAVQGQSGFTVDTAEIARKVKGL